MNSWKPKVSLKYGLALMTGAFSLAGCGHNDDDDEGDTDKPPVTAAVQQFASKATACGTGETPETVLQGQVPVALRQLGFKVFNCKLKLVGQFRGEGGNWSTATFRDKAGRTCAYHSTGSLVQFGTNAPVVRQNPGVR